ncbi:UDP-glucose dehydrogenase family protein [Helicobacter bilis]|uniref:UDP-glucose dehydrogenase family protein n=1 Tax=Helicobacter bilis TaxID=37372 RepID=UPI00051D22F5|nr:UDP-glucose/GDP-mannose dehydrogenase family protein [Helicobacter bilis]TLE09716.1 UDP-glucose/GDP-mannose dehydrogenase family protein [Helicobacter bilis]
MQVTIIGSGYVGLVAGACFAQMGNEVICLDVDSKKIESLKQGKIPIYEPGLEEMVRENARLKTLRFSTDKKEAISNAEVIFIAVGTPMGEDGSADLSFVKAVAQDIGSYIEREYVVVVDKSTVPVGTARKVRRIIESALAKRGRHSVLSDKSGSASPCSLQRTTSASHSQDLHNPNFSSQSLECQDSSDTDSNAEVSLRDFGESANLDSSNSKIVSEKCGLQEKSQGSYLSGNDRRDFSQLPHLSPQAELPNNKDTTQKITFDVVSNPEFLKEGVAIKDFMSPDRVVIGTDSTRALEVMKALYAPFLLKSDRLIAMGIESAEMTKYAANAMLATKISFINEMSQICERVGANINDVRQGIGSDSRIGYSFIYPGCGYGGSCFPKDVRALEKSAKDVGYTAKILQAVQEVNEKQKMLLVEKIVRHFGENLQGLSFCVWGLSFKPETDDMREASSLVLINELTKRGARIQAYDPKAHEQARFYLKDKLSSITFMESKYSALQGCAALVLLTEWREFRSPDFGEIAKLLKEPIIFDGRNIYQHCGLESKGFAYYQIGVGNIEL